MTGLEISREYYFAFGEPMLREQFPELLPHVAAGLCGSGSECFGWDDEVSRDHDFEPGFCLFLPGEDVVDRRAAFALERAYARLPKEFAGLRRGGLAPVGGARRGVLRLADFFTEKTGSPDGLLSPGDWLRVPEQGLAEAVNGEIFYDGPGELSDIRGRLALMPEDARRKKLAGELLRMAQAGQYNYARCLAHGESGAAQLAVTEFARAAMHTVFLLNRRYMPFYKWSFRAMRTLPLLAAEADTLEFLISTDNRAENAEEKQYAIEDLAARVISELQAQSLTAAVCGDLEKHAWSVNDHVADAALRNRNIFYGVE
ncbi:MAG: DUF4037 domain-containing protein [Oscillospiraceae bacterium]|nr:DUF4037 domain-containing protein [Oscillospiraceae bacterium]